MPAPPSTPPAAGDVDDATTGRRPATAVLPVAVDDGPRVARRWHSALGPSSEACLADVIAWCQAVRLRGSKTITGVSVDRPAAYASSL